MPVRTAAAEIVLLGLALLLVGCEQERKSTPAIADASQKAPAAIDAATPPPPTVAPPSPRPAPDPSALRTCRILGGDNLALPRGPIADVGAWMTLADKSNASVRFAETGRELRFEGPGVVRPCAAIGNVGIAELGLGAASGLPGAGEGAGSEQWLATPCGAARWSSGAPRATAAPTECTIQGSLGGALVWVSPDARTEDDAGANVPWVRVAAKQTLRLALSVDKGGPARAVDACERESRKVYAASSKMSAPGASVESRAAIGELAAEAMVARELARAACGVAEVRVHRAGDDAALAARVRTAEAMAFGETTPEGDAGHGR